MSPQLKKRSVRAFVEKDSRTLGGRSAALLLVTCLVVLVPGTWVSLFDRDEGWYAEVSREMVTRSDWLVPRYLGEVWLAKPPLLYWLVSASFRVFGIGEWQARLVPVLASIGNVLLAGALGARMFGRRAGVLAGLILVTSGLPALVGKMLLTDSLLLLSILSAVVLHWDLATRGPRHSTSAVYWIAIGLGILAKGPAVLLFAGAFGLALLVARPAGRRDWLRNWRWWSWLPLAVAISLPWYWYINQIAGGTLRGQFFGEEILSRLVSTPHGHGGPPGYYLLLSMAGLLPWTVLVPGALVNAVRQARTTPSPDAANTFERQALRTLLIWLAMTWIVLELVPSKLPHYILPCYVPLAILLGRELAAIPESTVVWPALPKEHRAVLGLWVFVTAGLGVVFILLAGLMWWQMKDPWICLSLVCIGALLVIGFFAGPYVQMRKGQLRAGLTGAILVTVGMWFIIGMALLPALEPHRLSRNLAEEINRLARENDPVYLCGYEEPTAFFYIDASARPIAAGAVPELLAPGHPPAVLVISDRALRQLDTVTRARLQPLLPLQVTGLNYVKMQPATLLLGRVTPN